MSRTGVSIEGLAPFRRGLRQMDRSLDVNLRQELKAAAEPIRQDAQRRAPQGSRPIPASRSPRKRLADSLTVQVRGNTVAIRSGLPYAKVVHGLPGGRPARRPFDARNRSDWRYVQPRPFITEAVEANANRLLDGMEDAVDQAARAAGWR